MDKHRLQLLSDALKITLTELETNIGATRSRLTNAVKRNSKITRDIVEMIVEVYPTVNRDWLLSGKGSMFIEETPSTLEKLPKSSAMSFKGGFLIDFIKRVESGLFPVSKQDIKDMEEMAARWAKEAAEKLNDGKH